ncbi:SPT16 protein, partial [Bucco capensis]|nr:SPT16 protein [Bucco capensis]
HTGEAAENKMEEKEVEKEKEQSNDVDKTNSKEQLNHENPSVTKEETKLGSDHLLTLASLSHIPLKSLTDIEMELVYIDEEDISFEFTKFMVSTSPQPSCQDSEKANALRERHGSVLPCIDKQLQKTLHKASSCYRQNNYEEAVEQFSAALELCSEGYALDNHWESSSEDISSVASFIETKLAICYLKLKNPGDALDHAHRSITLNPANFQNHLRQAAAFRCLERYSEAARSTMIAGYMYWLTGGTDQHTSKLIKQYWQAMIEEAITKETSFSVMYTPFLTRVKDDKIKKIDSTFAEKHPGYVKHIYTDPHEFHILPQTSDWLALPPQQYLLTVGFRKKHIGKHLERCSRRKLPIFSAQKAPFSTLMKEAAEKYWDNTGKEIMSVMDFVRSTKLIDNHCPCSRGLEKLQYASLLGCMQRGREQSQVINQAMAELATVPYLQDISQQDFNLLQSLMADAMDILGGVRNDNKCVWSQIQKV